MCCRFLSVVQTNKHICDHFLFVAFLLEELLNDFSLPREMIFAQTILVKIDYLLRTLTFLENLQKVGLCLPPAYRG